MRDVLIVLLVIGPALAIANLLYASKSLRGFLKGTTQVDTTQALQAFRSLAKRQMYAALLQILYLLMPIPVYGFISMTHLVDPALAMTLLLPLYVLVIGLSVFNSRLERAAQSLPTAPEFTDEYVRTILVWTKKAFPNW